MRLIDADALTKVLRIQEDEWGTPDETWMPESDYGRVIKSMPTIDPVKHGRWIEEPHLEGTITRRCSECMKVAYITSHETPHANYCPNCGARVDGEMI